MSLTTAKLLAIVFAAVACIVSATDNAAAATKTSTPPGVERMAKKVKGKKKIKLTKKENRAANRDLTARTGRSYNEYIGPYCVQYNVVSYTEYFCQWQETFGMWMTWTHTWRNYGRGWVDLGWTFY